MAKNSSEVAKKSAAVPVAKSEAAKQPKSLARFIPWLLVIGGIIGLLCAFVIGYDEFKLSQNPHFVPSCNLNPVISCGSVMQSKQAHAFGFPNVFIGFTAFAVVITSGMALLAGAKLKRWYWRGLEAGTIFGIGFVHWLFFQTVYRIHALCPYCMAIWTVTITTFLYVTLYNLETGAIPAPAKLTQQLRKHHIDILVLWLVIIAGLILKHFWYYYGHYF